MRSDKEALRRPNYGNIQDRKAPMIKTSRRRRATPNSADLCLEFGPAAVELIYRGLGRFNALQCLA